MRNLTKNKKCVLILSSMALFFVAYDGFAVFDEEAIVRKLESIEEQVVRAKNSDWKCCKVPQHAAVHPSTEETVALQGTEYTCNDRPSNFEWYHADNLPELNATKWKPRKIFFAGASTVRQMKEQLEWEIPSAEPQMYDEGDLQYQTDHFIFRQEHEYRNLFHGLVTLDLRQLSPGLEAAMKIDYDFIILNVGIWWELYSVGNIIELDGKKWKIQKTLYEEWRVQNFTNGLVPDVSFSSRRVQSVTNGLVPDVSFAALMKRGLTMILSKKHPKTQIVWRSESKPGCPTGGHFRYSIEPVLKELHIPVLDISEATCQYNDLKLDDSMRQGVHFCFPSVLYRYWLQRFQHDFL